MLSVPTVLFHRDSAKEAEPLVLRHENAVLRRPITGPVQLRTHRPVLVRRAIVAHPAAALEQRLPDQAGHLLAWHRKLIAAK